MAIPPFDIFLKLAGFAGEVTAQKYKDEIEVLSYEQGIDNPLVHGIGGGVASGRATFSDVRFRKPLDRSTPLLMVACASGQRIADARFAFVRASSGGQQEFCRVTLTDVVITALTQTAGDDAQYPLSFDALDTGASAHGILDILSLAYSTIVWEYTPISKSGKAEPLVTTGWDRASNAKL
jgi:type VI secretion system secreted protein Hcp